ncbi:LamG-like jellyroll fold domain-containing protein [Planctomycetota bacterium]
MSSKAILKMYLIIVLAFLISTGRDANADFTFGTPTNLGPTVNSPLSDGLPRITADGLELYFNSNRSGGNGNYDVWVLIRETADSDWGEPMNLGPTINSSAEDGAPSISADGLTLFFESSRSGGYGNNDLYVTTRQTTDDPFGPPVNLGPTVNSSSLDSGPCISIDGLSLFFMSNRPGGSGGDNVWLTTRETINGEWSAPVNLGPNVNGSGLAGFPYISDDGLLLFFASIRAGGYGAVDIWLAKWNTKDDIWGAPVNLGPVINSSRDELSVCISGNGSTLFFSSRRSGGVGDQDMIVLSEHLFEDVDDPTLIAHWALDETEGMYAVDSVSENNAIVMGGATWQPDGGQKDGALQLDGIDGCAITNPVLNPTDGPFSIFAWIKGGEPGQVVISQQSISNWLTTDTEGNLMTELKCTGRSTGPLFSEAVITDGQWHRIGLVWDGSKRMLYVDSVIVAEDVQTGLAGSNSGLYIGCGKGRESGTFFSGLIDDVRIYNRVVNP